MRRLCLFAAFVLSSVCDAGAQSYSYNFFGYDAGRSQHSVRLVLTPATSIKAQSLSVYFDSFYFQPGQMLDCGYDPRGCGWSTDVPNNGPFNIDYGDAFHGSVFCWGLVGDPTNAMGGRYCTGADSWGGGGIVIRDVNWFPTTVTVNLRYSDLTTRSLVLTQVPEPATVALLGVGLLAVGAVARRRRS